MKTELSPLEALEEIILELCNYRNVDENAICKCKINKQKCDNCSQCPLFKKGEIIETALKHYEEGIKNAETYVPHSSKDALFDLQVLAMKNTHRDYWKLPQQLANDVKKELKALEIVKELFDFDFTLRFPSNQPMLRITNKQTNEYWEMPIPKDKYELLKEVLL